MATIVDVSNTKYPGTFKGHKIQPMEGINLIPILDNKPTPERTLFWEHESRRAVRQGKWKLVAGSELSSNWKLVAGSELSSWELYDMELDRTETNNLATQHPEIVESLGKKYQEWAVRAKVLPNRKPPTGVPAESP